MIVEARQYQHGSARIVVPWVFGFTEEARAVKRGSQAETVRSSPPKGEAAFWERIAHTTLRDEWKKSMRDFVAAVAATSGCEVKWLVGCVVGLPEIVPRKTLLTVNGDGSVQLYIANWKPQEGGTLTDKQLATRDAFFDKLQSVFDFSQSDLQTKQYPLVRPDRWRPKSDELLHLIRQLAGPPNEE